MPRHASDIRAALEPYRNILLFVAAMLLADWLWKLTVRGDEGGESVFWLCFDLTPFFDMLARHTAQTVYDILQPFKPGLFLSHGTLLGYEGGASTRIAWSCTPVKQAFIFAAILLSAPPYKGRAWHKLWYLPLCLVLVYAVNILRIAVVVLVIEHRPDLFHLMHDHLLKYAFYGILFLMWVVWGRISRK